MLTKISADAARLHGCHERYRHQCVSYFGHDGLSVRSTVRRKKSSVSSMVSAYQFSAPSPGSGGHCGCSVYDAPSISFAVVAATDNAKARKRWEMMAQRMFSARQQHLAQFLNARFVLRIANVDNFTVAAISAFSIMRYNASIPSRISVKQRFCFPPSISLIGEPSTRLRMSCVIARELPIRAALGYQSWSHPVKRAEEVNCKPSFRHRPRSPDQVIVLIPNKSSVVYSPGRRLNENGPHRSIYRTHPINF